MRGGRGRTAWHAALLLWIVLVPCGVAGSEEPAVAGSEVADELADGDVLVDVGGHRLRARILGDGGPTVVFDTGFGDGLDRWGAVPQRIASVRRVVLYDRSGYGQSELGPTPRTAERVAEELHSLLEGLGLQPPFVLVGHSLAGIHLRAFTHRYPDEVAGLVFLDVTIEGMFQSLFTEEGRSHYESLVADYPPGLRDEGLGFYHKLVALPTFEVPSPPVPTVVITAAAEPHIPPEARAEAEAAGITLEILQQQRKLKLELGAMLAEKFSGRHVLAEASGHYVHHDEPDLVTAETLAILEAIRSQAEPSPGGEGGER